MIFGREKAMIVSNHPWNDWVSLESGTVMDLTMRCGLCMKRIFMFKQEFMIVSGNDGFMDVFIRQKCDGAVPRN